MALIKVGVIHEPLEFLLFSGFSVVVAYVHQPPIFMIVPIFNSMGRIDKRVVEAALDAGASRFDIMRISFCRCPRMASRSAPSLSSRSSWAISSSSR